MSGQIEIAKAIATIAHRGQVDKGDAPYIDHPRRVAGLIPAATETEIAAAWLHDVLEDTDITREDLNAAGVSWPVINIVETLTRTKEVPAEDYYAAIAGHYHARRVKRADIADNLNAIRLSALDDVTIARLVRKYAKALMLIDPGVVA